MDKIQKVLRRLNGKEKKVVKPLLAKILTGQLEGLDVLKLSGHKDIYRVKKGSWRVIYQLVGKETILLTIERRSEKTYRDF